MSREDDDGLLAGIDASAMMGHLEELARWTKHAGSDEEKNSLDYIKATLESYGYRTSLIRHPAFISLPVDARIVIDGMTIACITHSHARSTPEGGLTGRLVHVGRGSASDFARDDISGAIVLVEGLVSSGVTSRASAAGAIAQIHLSPHEQPHEGGVSPVWGSPSIDDLQLMPSTAVLSIGRTAGRSLVDAALAGSIDVTVHATVDTGWRLIPLLEAHMPTVKDICEEPFVLLSGHHDTWHRGVMDNGSANALMLEAARILAQVRGQWKRALRLCFWSGHSHGRYAGSTWYADNRFEEMERRCIANVNLDSVGGVGATMLENTRSDLSTGSLADDAILEITGQRRRGLPIQRNCDMSFWGVGIPAMFGLLSEQAPENIDFDIPCGWWWHTPDDLIDKISPDFMARDTKIVARVLWRLLAEERLPLRFKGYLDIIGRTLTALTPAHRQDLDLEPVLLKLSALESLLLEFESSTETGSAHDDTAIKLSRVFTNLEKVGGDRFSHGLVQAAPVVQDEASTWPVLGPFHLANMTPSEEKDWYFILQSAYRSRNRINAALAEAITILNSSRT
ncbi:M28 family peptidase [Rhizobium puerariae]|uniref:M28 family peptidase n=1 Tax=Rhizobium puerariae TaxID=1585791 RepID=A0ABV6AMU1_9HYPH